MSDRPRLLDLFSGAGGAAVGYHRAGFEVVGVDLVPQPRYPFEFHQADALTFPLEGFDAVHASPPCQRWSRGGMIGNRRRNDHPSLIAPTRERLRAWGGPYVIENVELARPELLDAFMLCGSSLGLPDLERHRLFESNIFMLVPPCAHGMQGAYRFPGTPRTNGERPGSRVVNQMASGTTHDMLAAAMGIDWMPASKSIRPTKELRNAIPPAYTEFVGARLLEVVR